MDSTWKDLLGASATITTIGQFLSGMFTVRKVIRQGVAGELSPVPFLMGVIGCSLWLFYGRLKADSTIINCNVVGTLLNLFYVLVFFNYTIGKTLIARQMTGGLITIISLVFFVNQSENPVETLGRICIVVSVISCASPLVALRTVLKSQSTDSLPFPLILSMFLVCSQWWAYGVLIDDFYMQFPNLLGSLIALVQLSLFVIFPKQSNPHVVLKY